LESIIDQSFLYYELICVNDGSTDLTTLILDKYQKKDERIIIINNECRLGAAHSRNKGLSLASSECIIFLDSDDIYAPDMLKIAYENMIHHHADVVEFTIDIFAGNDYSKEMATLIYQGVKSFHGKNITIKEFPSQIILEHLNGPINKLYKKAFIHKYQLLFQDLECCNDVYFTLMSVMLADKYFRIDSAEALAHVRQHDTISRISTNRNIMCIYLALYETKNGLVKRGLWNTLYNHYFIKAIFTIFGEMSECKNEAEKEVFYKFIQSEGFSTLFEGLGSDEKLEPYIKTRYEKFINEPYQSKWWEEEDILSLHLMNNDEIVIKIFADAKINQKSIGLWGCGKRGKAIIEFCQLNHLSLDAIIDRDKNKHGLFIGNYQVQYNDDILKELDIIIVSTSEFYDEVSTTLAANHSHIKQLDINKLLCL